MSIELNTYYISKDKEYVFYIPDDCKSVLELDLIRNRLVYFPLMPHEVELYDKLARDNEYSILFNEEADEYVMDILKRYMVRELVK